MTCYLVVSFAISSLSLDRGRPRGRPGALEADPGDPVDPLPSLPCTGASLRTPWNSDGLGHLHPREDLIEHQRSPPSFHSDWFMDGPFTYSWPGFTETLGAVAKRCFLPPTQTDSSLQHDSQEAGTERQPSDVLEGQVCLGIRPPEEWN